MVFRRDNKGGEAFQRQISALRQQLGGSAEDEMFEGDEGAIDEASYNNPGYSPGGYEPEDTSYRDSGYRAEYAYEEESAVDSYSVPASAIPAADASMTVVSNDTSWKGEVDSEGSMHIHGRYDGVIRAREDVFILEEAIVSAEVHARNVVIAGNYSGDVWCETRFEVLPSGRVQGAVRAPELVVHDGAVINGSIQMTDIEPAGSRPAAPASLVARRAESRS
ncbi:MAG: polymer-forming cytoskeletal protein [Thermomicrobiales bacterium]|nr:polymer-forming cytoskeletal protein [Thermomicrobiales bacterium]